MAKAKSEATESGLESLIKPRVAIAASLHAGAMIPGGGGTATTLSQSKQPGIKLVHMPGCGIFMHYKGRDAFTPDTNIKDVWYEQDTKLS
jgi:hypothetical protein